MDPRLLRLLQRVRQEYGLYAAHAQTVAPLRFKTMPGYPFGSAAAYPDSHREYQLEWNTREVAGESWPS